MPRLRRPRLIPLADMMPGKPIARDRPRKGSDEERDCEFCGEPFRVTRANPAKAGTPTYQRYCGWLCSQRSRRRRKRLALAVLPDTRITTTENGERYYVIAVTGWLIQAEITQGTYNPGTSYSILDADWGHREVQRFYSSSGRASSHLERQARRRCAELNADEFAWERREGIYAESATA